MAYVYFTLVCLCFGSNFILMDRATRWFSPVEVGYARVTSAAVLLGLLWLTVDRRQRVGWKHLGVLAAIGVFANAYPYGLQPALIAGGLPHSFFGMLVALVPLLTIVASIPLLGVRPSSRQLVGVLGGFACVVLLMYDGHLRDIPIRLLLLAVTVPASYAIGNTWMKRSLQDADPTPLSVLMMAIASAALLPMVLSSDLQAQVGVQPPEPRQGFGMAISAIVLLGALGTGVCVWAFVRMVQERGPLFAGMVTYVVPVVAGFWGVFDGQQITARQITATAGILGMVALVQAPSKRPVEEPAEEWPAEPLMGEA